MSNFRELLGFKSWLGVLKRYAKYAATAVHAYPLIVTPTEKSSRYATNDPLVLKRSISKAKAIAFGKYLRSTENSIK